MARLISGPAFALDDSRIMLDGQLSHYDVTDIEIWIESSGHTREDQGPGLIPFSDYAGDRRGIDLPDSYAHQDDLPAVDGRKSDDPGG